jgi:hypothetical protein
MLSREQKAGYDQHTSPEFLNTNPIINVLILIYTQLLNLNDDEWTCRTANNVKESTQLIEAGFEYVTEQDRRIQAIPKTQITNKLPPSFSIKSLQAIIRARYRSRSYRQKRRQPTPCMHINNCEKRRLLN